MLSDLHCHTYFSVDGYASPEAVLEAALARGVRQLAITEHNSIASIPRAKQRAKELGIEYFPGVELDLFWQGRQLHLLAYGFDPENSRLQQLIDRHLSVYAAVYPHLLCEMEERGLPVDYAALAAAKSRRYPSYPEQVDNLWFWLRYFRDQGQYPEDLLLDIVAKARERVKATGGCEGFADVEEGRDCIRKAGGVLLLAHVGRYLPGKVDAQLALLSDLLDAGLDGFELYHPANCKQAEFPKLEQFARERGCLISGGSDTHALEGHSLGSMSTPPALLAPLLKELRERSRSWRFFDCTL